MWKNLIPALAVFAFTISGVADEIDASNPGVAIVIPDEPLALTDALNYASNWHPSDQGKVLDYELALDTHQQLKSESQLDVRLRIVPQRVNRAAVDTSGNLDDSYARLELAYPIFDFGRKKTSVDQAAITLDIAERNVDRSLKQRQLLIMERFFNVLIADLDYDVKNEKMTLAFLRYNRYQEELNMFEAHAEVDVLELETIYRDTFLVRQQAGIEQLAARRHLGMAMGFVDYVPRDLQVPDLSDYVDREVPELELMLEQVLEQSNEMAVARLNLENAKLALTAAEKRYQPHVEARVEATEWNQKIGSRNEASIGMQIKVPLVSGNRKSRDRKDAQIGIDRAGARLAEIEHELRKQVLDIWRNISLYHVALAAAQVRSDYRDQYMDRARSLYELEEVADIGDAQAEQLRAYLELKKVEFGLALAWSEFDMLRGEKIILN